MLRENNKTLNKLGNYLTDKGIINIGENKIKLPDQFLIKSENIEDLFNDIYNDYDKYYDNID